MPTKPFDSFNKRLFQTLLKPSGVVFPDFSVLGEARRIDIFFAPFQDTEPTQQNWVALQKCSIAQPYLNPIAAHSSIAI
jgi:hypothetical protein